MSEEKVFYNADQQRQASSLDPRHFLVTLARDGKAIKGPIYVGAVNRLAAARIAYDKLPSVKDSDTLLVWTLIEFEMNDLPGEYAVGDLRPEASKAQQQPGESVLTQIQANELPIQPKNPGDIILNFADCRYYLITAKQGSELTGLRLRTGKWGRLIPTETTTTLTERGSVVIIRPPHTGWPLPDYSSIEL